MTVYSFFIICNTNSDLDFHIECTSMADYRLRFSAMKSAYKQKLKFKSPFTFSLSIHSKSKKCEYNDNVCDTFESENENDNENDNLSPAFKLHNLFQTNFVYYLLEKKTFDTLEDAQNYRKTLIQQRLKRYTYKCVKTSTNLCKFTISF